MIPQGGESRLSTLNTTGRHFFKLLMVKQMTPETSSFIREVQIKAFTVERTISGTLLVILSYFLPLTHFPFMQRAKSPGFPEESHTLGLQGTACCSRSVVTQEFNHFQNKIQTCLSQSPSNSVLPNK